MDLGAGIAPVDHTAGVPEGPSCGWGGVGYACRCGFEEVELVCRIVV